MAVLTSALVARAYRIAGIQTQAGRGYSPSQGTEGLNVLNSFLDACQSESLMVYAIERDTFPTVSGKATYTIGASGADVTLMRPVKIDRASLLLSTTTPPPEIPIHVALSDQEWQAVPTKTLTSTLPQVLYYQPFVPNGVINLWPVPTTVQQIALYLWRVLQQVASLATSIDLPPTYQEFIEYNLARRIALSFPTRQKMSQDAYEIARTSRATVKAANYRPLLMQCEAAAGSARQTERRYNIFTNQYITGN